MNQKILLYILIIENIKKIISLITNELKYITIPYNDDYSIPIIFTQINGIKIETVLDNNINFNYLTTKSFNLSDINFHYNTEKINIKGNTYDAYFYIGNISIYDNNNSVFELENFNSFVIDDKSIISSITIFFILQQLEEKLLIDNKQFLLDINHKKCIFGDITKDQEEYKQKPYFDFDLFANSIFYSGDSKGVFKAQLKRLYIANNYISIEKNISFNINEKFTFIPYNIIKEITNDKKISNLDCQLFLLDSRGKYTIKCHKKEINKLPNLVFLFNNSTFNIPFSLLFEEYDSNYCISLIRNKIKLQNIEDEKKENEENEWEIGYSIIKNFNYTLFDYDRRAVIFYSDSLIGLNPPKNAKKLSKNIFYLLSIILGISSIFLLFIRIKINRIPLDAKK